MESLQSTQFTTLRKWKETKKKHTMFKKTKNIIKRGPPRRNTPPKTAKGSK